MMNSRIARTIACGLGAISIAMALAQSAAAEPESPPAATGDRRLDVPSRDWLTETKADNAARMDWWRKARFGIFIHWGLYAVPAGFHEGKPVRGTGEWLQRSADLDANVYEQFAGQFNPIKFDAAQWVRIAREAGCKYIVITAKHHEGFAMYDTQVGRYSIVRATPYGKDPIKALQQACDKEGIKCCFYYSIMDWHHPSQFRHPQHGWSPTLIHEQRKQPYIDFMKAQLKELIEGYQPAVLWFDGEWVPWWTEQDGRDLYAYCRSLKPDIVINNRVGKARTTKAKQAGFGRGVGDFGTPEQEIPPAGMPGVDWESCMTMNETWGHRRDDDKWKSSETLIRNLIDIASKGGNYLLNVGPDAEGRIPEPSVQRLSEIGRWMKVNGEAIWGTTASPYTEQLSWGRVTSKPDKLYLHVFTWPDTGQLIVPRLAENLGPFSQSYLLSDPQKTDLKISQKSDDWIVHVPDHAPDPVASVIVLERQKTDQQ